MSRLQANLTKMYGAVSDFIGSPLSTTTTLDPATNPQAQPPATDTAPTDPTEDLASAVQVPPIINQEFGVDQSSYFTRFELDQYSPDELITKKGFKIYEQMYNDDQIHLAITALKLMRLASGFEVVEASQDAKDIEIADFVADNLLKVEGGLNDILFNLMGCLEMGWSLNEKIWDFYEDGPWEGKCRLKALKSKNPQWFNPAVDDFNNITGVVMISPPAFGRKLPADKFIVYSFMKRYENIFGTARTRALYDWYWIKRVTRRALGVFLEKFGNPVAVGKYPIAMQKADRDNMLRALQQLKIATAITLPDGCTVDFLEASKQGAEAFLQTIEKCDQQIVKVIMGQTMSTGTSSAHTSGAGQGAGGNSGASSGAKGGQVAMDVLSMYLDYIGNHLAEGPMQLLIKELVDYNWSGVYNYPTFKFKPMSKEDLTGNVKIFIDAAQARIGATPGGPPDENGDPTTPGDPGVALINLYPEDEERIRDILGFPSVQGKNALRTNRYVNKPVPISVKPREIDPLKLPWAGYRPPTPSGPGKSANYSEAFKPARKLTKYEDNVDFSESKRILDETGVDEVGTAVAAVIRKAVEKIKVQAKKIGGDTGKIKNLVLPYRSELVKELRDGLNKVAKQALAQAAQEVSRANPGKTMPKKYDDLGGMEPQEVLDYIDDKSFTMGNDISDEVLKKIKQAMYAGVKKGESYKDIIYRVEDSIAPYIDLVAADDELSGHRLETAIRTGVAEAYNEARKSIFQDPDLDGFVLAYQYSSILDDRTTDWCQNEEDGGMDGRIFKVSNPIWDKWTPPVWYNCRSVLVPITKVDDWDGEESDLPDIEPPAGFN